MRCIIHSDLCNFYASVECMLKPSLKDVPLVVGGDETKRHGIVLAKNPLAKAKGIKTGDTLWEARRKEPSIVIVPPHFDTYMHYSQLANEIYIRYTSKVEAYGADECWLDVTNSKKLFGSGKEIADDIRKIIKQELGLTVSCGVSFNKIFAKLASDMADPDATLEITKDNFKEKLYNLPCDKLMGIGRKTYPKLLDYNIRTIGDLALANPIMMKRNFGINGLKMIQFAKGEDNEPVREYVESREMQSIGHGMTATKDIVTYDDSDTVIYYLADLVARRMRRTGVQGKGVAVGLRDSNLESITRQTKLIFDISNATQIAKAAIQLTRDNWNRSLPLRTITVSVFNLSMIGSESQISMFEQTDNRPARLDAALDTIRSRYGYDKIIRANLIERDFIYDKSDAEDFLPFMR
ncbi:MAG: DNA polymerase IV [Firmicutes bacterium]|nr:DNA polymerase IV [Bacillota bacterium]